MSELELVKAMQLVSDHIRSDLRISDDDRMTAAIWIGKELQRLESDDADLEEAARAACNAWFKDSNASPPKCLDSRWLTIARVLRDHYRTEATK